MIMFDKQELVKKNLGFIFIFTIFLIFLINQFKYVFIYFDDFGYLSLSYGYIVDNVKGHDYNIIQFFEYVYNHFLLVNGRLLYASLLPLINYLFGINGVKYFMAFVILIFSLLIYKEGIEGKNLSPIKSTSLAIFISLLYGIIGLSIHNQGTYWFAASYLYITPIIIFLIFLKKYYQISLQLRQNPSKKNKVLLMFLAFISGFSSEQWLSATVGIIIIIILVKMFNKLKVKLYDILILLSAFLGGLPILLSPAVRDRMSNNPTFLELTLIERISGNIKNIVNLFFSSYNNLYLIVLVATLIILSLHLIEYKKGFIYNNILYILFSVIVLYKIVILNVVYISETLTGGVVTLTLYLLWSLVQITLFYKNQPNKFPCYIMFAAYLSLICLVIVPEIPLRVMLPFILLSFMFISDVFVKVVINTLQLTTVFIIILAMLAIPNVTEIYSGYKDNYEIHMENDSKLRNYNQGSEVLLEKSIDPLYGSAMMYFDGVEYMKFWMLEYYDLPIDTEIIFVDNN